VSYNGNYTTFKQRKDKKLLFIISGRKDCKEEGKNIERPEPVFVNVQGAQESIPPAYVAWRAGMTNRVVVPIRQTGNRFLGSSIGLQIRAQEKDFFVVGGGV
jgi:hypothetical protein